MGTKSELTLKEEKFVAAYVIENNGTKAAKAAGYAASSAGVTACQLLKKPKILSAIRERTKAHVKAVHDKTVGELDISRQRILEEYARIAFLDPRKLYDAEGNVKAIADLDEDTARGIASSETEELTVGEGAGVITKRKVKLWNKLGGLDSLAKITGLMKEGTNVQVGIGLAIEINI